MTPKEINKEDCKKLKDVEIDVSRCDRECGKVKLLNELDELDITKMTPNKINKFIYNFDELDDSLIDDKLEDKYEIPYELRIALSREPTTNYKEFHRHHRQLSKVISNMKYKIEDMQKRQNTLISMMNGIIPLLGTYNIAKAQIFSIERIKALKNLNEAQKKYEEKNRIVSKGLMFKGRSP